VIEHFAAATAALMSRAAGGGVMAEPSRERNRRGPETPDARGRAAGVARTC